jgi:hypothetical protein
MPATAMKARIPAMSPSRLEGGAPGAGAGACGGIGAAAADIALTPAAIVCSAAAAEATGVYAGRAAVADVDTGLGAAGAIPAAAGEAATTVVPQ